MITTGEVALEFHGPKLRGREIADFSHCLQIGPDEYLGRSGGPDDMVNHSCAPTCGIVEADGRFFLIALRRLSPGMEITFDYSTSMCEEPWAMSCECREPHCRGRVEGFWTLPVAVRKRYLTRGVVLPHVVAGRPRPSRTPQPDREGAVVSAC